MAFFYCFLSLFVLLSLLWKHWIVLEHFNWNCVTKSEKLWYSMWFRRKKYYLSIDNTCSMPSTDAYFKFRNHYHLTELPIVYKHISPLIPVGLTDPESIYSETRNLRFNDSMMVHCYAYKWQNSSSKNIFIFFPVRVSFHAKAFNNSTSDHQSID